MSVSAYTFTPLCPTTTSASLRMGRGEAIRQEKGPGGPQVGGVATQSWICPLWVSSLWPFSTIFNTFRQFLAAFGNFGCVLQPCVVRWCQVVWEIYTNVNRTSAVFPDFRHFPPLYCGFLQFLLELCSFAEKNGFHNCWLFWVFFLKEKKGKERKSHRHQIILKTAS